VQAPGGNYAIVQPYGTSKTFTLNTASLSGGVCNVAVWIKSAGTSPSGGYDVSIVASPMTLIAPTVSLSPNQALSQSRGTPIVFSATGAGGSGSYQYEFWLQSPNGTWAVAQAYGASPTFTLQTGGLPAGTYAVAVWIRNTGATPTTGWNACTPGVPITLH
jgi:hypothetical protein